MTVRKPEYIEMESTPSDSSETPSCRNDGDRGNNGVGDFVATIVKKEYQLRAFSDRPISHWWVTLPVLFYLVAIIGGIMTSISVGNVFAAFDSFCIFNASLDLVNIDGLGGNKTLEISNVQISWGSKTECLFSEYASVTCVMFCGVWIVMVLQCGRGGASRRGFRLPDAWRIVPPTCIGNFVFLIISSIILAKVSSGFTGFCNNINFDPVPSTGNMSCIDVLGYHFPSDKFHTDLVQEYRLSHIGAIVQFVGCLLGFLLVTLRCCTGADFDVYERKQIAYLRTNTEDPDLENDLMEDGDEDCYDSGPSTSKNTTTVICHNPTMNMMDADPIEFSSLTSETELISEPKGSKDLSLA